MTPSPRQAWAVVVAAGRGTRMSSTQAKQFLPLCGVPVVEWSLQRLLATSRVVGIQLVLPSSGLPVSCALPALRDPRVDTTSGGAMRMDSVLCGLDALCARGAAMDDWVLVHDAARPCLDAVSLERLLDGVTAPDGGLLAVPVADTLKRAHGAAADAVVADTVSRADLWRAQTPQMFPLGSLFDALTAAKTAGIDVSDEAGAMEHAGYRPRLIMGDAANIKITTDDDLLLATALLGAQQ